MACNGSYGGHTDGFKPMETLEYYRDGVWHEVPMHYSHDNGFALPLPEGSGRGSSPHRKVNILTLVRKSVTFV